MDHGQALLLRDSSNHLANCFGFEHKPDELSVRANSGQAVWHVTLKPQASLDHQLRPGLSAKRTRPFTIWPRSGRSTLTPRSRRCKATGRNGSSAMFTPGNSLFLRQPARAGHARRSDAARLLHERRLALERLSHRLPGARARLCEQHAGKQLHDDVFLGHARMGDGLRAARPGHAQGLPPLVAGEGHHQRLRRGIPHRHPARPVV